MELILSIFFIVIENYNDQFRQYYGSQIDVEGLINTVIEINENGEEVTIEYDNNNYTSVDELNQLLSILLNNDKTYSMSAYSIGGLHINLIRIGERNY